MSGLRLLVAVMGIGLASATAAASEPAQPLFARFAEPTGRYPHNVLGDLPGFGALEVTLEGGAMLRLVLPEARVFEDIAPRLWDIDANGIAEIVVVESDQRLGARLTAWSARRGLDGTHSLALRAAGEFIGTRFRWLAPAGIADFTGDGRPDIAYVEMPHLARRLVLVGLEGERFVPRAWLGGVSNHRIGEDFITGGVRDCGAFAEIILPSADWRRVMGVTFRDDRLEAADLGPFTGAEALGLMLSCAR